MPHLLIVEARFYDALADALLDGARQALDAAGATHATVTVPGALEIPGAVGLAAERFDGFVALGTVIRGETYHFEVVASESARGLMALTLDGLAIGNGILTVEDERQAWARARRSREGQGRRGGEGGAGDDRPARALRGIAGHRRGATSRVPLRLIIVGQCCRKVSGSAELTGRFLTRARDRFRILPAAGDAVRQTTA